MSLPHRQAARLRKAKFIRAFRKYGIVALAARRVGVPRDRIYEWSAKDPEFKAQLQNAQAEITDMLEKTLQDLATGKIERPLVSGGKLVTHEKIYDVRALEMLLKAYRPKLFRERQNLEITGEGGGPVKVVKREITEVLIADVTKILIEAGVVGPDGTFGNHEQRALNAENPVPPTSALDEMRSARQ